MTDLACSVGHCLLTTIGYKMNHPCLFKIIPGALRHLLLALSLGLALTSCGGGGGNAVTSANLSPMVDSFG